ncbi:glycosyltransferase [Poseidonocella sp. HB161398]|uniref:glycosyltransferase n=1 Tax=Poseidonocella sp. HB161398 TaxID=2320855 RepID=UPI001486E15A|nr:glycosyltransferase [Poseidonocella sp. HB161398]
MKYLTVALYHPRVLRGGAQYVAKDLHDTAAKTPGVDAVLLACIDGNMFPQYGKVGASITSLPDSPNEFIMAGQRFDDFYHVVYDKRRNKALTRFLLDQKPDVIHFHHSLWVGLEFIELARKVLPNVKIIYTLHEYMAICHSRGQLFRYGESSICLDSSPDQCNKCFPGISSDDFYLRRRTFQRAFRFVDHFVSPSEYLKSRFVEWGIDAEKITVIHNGHQPSRPKGWQPTHSNDLNVFGFFGQFVDAKGIDVLLKAAALVSQETPVEIKIFGGNKQYASADYIGRIDHILSGNTENLKITEVGSYSRNNVFDLMSTVDWVVVPSVWPETFGLVVSEAWDAKRPVIASRAGGLSERIKDGTNGFSFLPGSDLQLSSILKNCIGNFDLWRTLVDKMKDEVTLDIAWKQHLQVVKGIRRTAGQADQLVESK